MFKESVTCDRSPTSSEVVVEESATIRVPVATTKRCRGRLSVHKGEGAPNKAHLCLESLYGLTRDEALTIRGIHEKSGVSTRDLGRILTRLVLEGRVSRYKRDVAGDNCFRYWLNPDQKRHFRRILSGVRHQAIAQPVFGSDELDALAGFGVKLVTSSREIAREKKRLEAEIHILQEKLKADRQSLSALKRTRRRLSKQAEASGKLLEKMRGIANLHGRPTQSEDLMLGQMSFRLSAMQASERLAFIQKLRQRPALADMATLKQIQADYAWVLQAITIDEEGT